MLIVLGIAVVALLAGLAFYYYGSSGVQEGQVAENVQASALSADAEEKIPFTVIAEGANAVDMSARKNYAVYDAEGFTRLWKMAQGEEGDVPEVDFERDYVIGVFAGEQATGGHEIEVESVTDGNAVRTVAITLSKPGNGCVTTQALTSPYQFVSVPFSDRELTRTNTEIEVACQ